MKLSALLVFILVQIAFIPFAIVGIALVFYKQTFTSKKLGVSGTAIEVINGRWAMDVFGLRRDTAAVKLSRVLPNNSILGMWLVLFPLYLRYRISGETSGYPTLAKPGEEGLAHIILNRTVYFDDLIERSVDNVEQFVVMGAGFDTRCYGDHANRNVSLFEIDRAQTQQLKIACLHAAAVDTSNTHYVEVDFATEQWYEKLIDSGFDCTKKTMFLWEGVTLYLSENEVRNTLKTIKENIAPGSVVVADFYALRFVKGDWSPGMKKLLGILKITNEELGFGVDFSSDPEVAFKAFLESEAIQPGQTYFMGDKTKKGAYMVVAELFV